MSTDNDHFEQVRAKAYRARTGRGMREKSDLATSAKSAIAIGATAGLAGIFVWAAAGVIDSQALEFGVKTIAGGFVFMGAAFGWAAHDLISDLECGNYKKDTPHFTP